MPKVRVVMADPNNLALSETFVGDVSDVETGIKRARDELFFTGPLRATYWIVTSAQIVSTTSSSVPKVDSDSPETERKCDYWVDVALDYDKDQAWIMGMSDDAQAYDVIDGSELEDAGISNSWIAAAVPGLYRLTLKPWAYQCREGEWDNGIDVTKIECLVQFPEIPANLRRSHA